MKVTAIIPDSLVREVKKLSKGKNITDSLIIALSEWVSITKLKKLNKDVEKFPLEFSDDFDAESLREINRIR